MRCVGFASMRKPSPPPSTSYKPHPTRPMFRSSRGIAAKPRRWLWASAIAALLAIVAFACGPSAAPVAAPVSEGLPSYTPDEAVLFDDTIDLTVFGRAATIRPAEDPKLPERVKQAESVL